jgi:hypothetical protein
MVRVAIRNVRRMELEHGGSRGLFRRWPNHLSHNDLKGNKGLCLGSVVDRNLANRAARG